MIASTQHDILFDDRSLLKVVVGDKVLAISSINTNCDCDGYYPTQTDEDLNPHQITASAVTID